MNASNGGPRVVQDDAAAASSSSTDGTVWIALFGCVLSASAIANATLVGLLVRRRRRRKRGWVDLLHCALFAIALLDHCLLIFELSLGLDHEYPDDGVVACKVYQMAAKATPILQSWVVVVLLWHAGRGRRNEAEGDDGRRPLQMPCVLLGLLATVVAASLPTAYFATIVSTAARDGQRFCEVDASSLASTFGAGGRQTAVSVYYLVYACLLPFWMPLMVAFRPMARLLRLHGKHVEVSTTVSTALSFFVFFFPHAVVVLVRHLVDAFGGQLPPYDLWMLKIVQSLMYLVAHFWHFARPTLFMSLDPDLRKTLRSASARCFGGRNQDDVATTTRCAVVVPVADELGQNPCCREVAANEEGAFLLSPVAAADLT